ncbi:MAG: FGGY family carbohydrate kinase [Gammaproteobacteria bacterium]
MSASTRNSEFVVAIDQGTTATKIHRLDKSGDFTTLESITHAQYFPQPGWVEHDANELLRSVERGIEQSKGAAGLGIDNQGETVVAWDAKTGEPIYNAIVWQDNRTHDTVERLRSDGCEALTLTRAGLPLDPYFSATKLRWILDHVANARALLAAGRLRMGTSDSFFLDRLCQCFVTDVTTASRTSLMNLRTRQWDSELCDLFGVPMSVLPQIVPCTGSFAEMGGGSSAPRIVMSIVDQQAALYGHGCRSCGDAKITFGTGAFALCVTGDSPYSDPRSGLLPTIAWQLHGQSPIYALDGGVYNAGSAIDWIRKLGLFSEYHQIDTFEGVSAIERGLVFVPALSGLACPYWDRSAAGMWLGLGLETTRHDLVRAVLEGVALRAAQVVAAMGKHVPMGASISIDGGLGRNGYFSRFLSAATGCEIVVNDLAELTGFGNAQLTASAVSLEIEKGSDAGSTRRVHSEPLAKAIHERFANAVDRSRAWRH